MSRVAATLLLGLAVATCASAAPTKTNGLLVFDSVGTAGNNDLFVVRAGGGPSHPISRGLALGDDPVWSLDGRRIVFVGGGRKREPRRDLYVVDRDGTHRRLIAKGPDINLVSWQVR